MTDARTAEWWQRVFEAADRTYELDPDERKAFLAQHSAEDPAFANELSSLLASGEAPSSLDAPAAEFAAPIFAITSGEVSAHADSHFGPYRITSTGSE